MENNWKFVEELKQPVKHHFYWMRTSANSGEVDFSIGCQIIADFPDHSSLLATSYEDMERFLGECHISRNGHYKIITSYGEAGENDSFRIQVNLDSCKIIAENTEGIRRGLFYLQDMLLASDGPFLKLGKIHRVAWIKNRISRCFFGPIKRPPFNRDELLDDVDYYPDEYLNRLAHEGINGLWLTVKFSDLCKTSITPEYGKDAVKRLKKLKNTVEKCLRYGIKTYIFCIEPAAWNADSTILKKYSELGGAKSGNTVFFCPFSKTSQKYLHDSVYSIFKAVPNLGGMINISYGERTTTCLSSVSAIQNHKVDCSVCSKKKHWEILYSSLSAMEKGMHAVAPNADLISWLYMPQADKLADWVAEIPKHTPENVILLLNFESGGEKEQLGKMRPATDYWLSYIGPSERFKNIANNAITHKTEMSAKIQVGCSHETATIPFIPVPSLLYRKYREMYKLGVSSVMQCWYFGNYPGIMNKAAGALAFEDFTGTEGEFLNKLALPDWGCKALEVVKAWKFFAEGYSNYPMSSLFQYYGLMHDGIVWPLYLYPAWKPLLPTWKTHSDINGDVIGDCLDNHNIEEAIELCQQMSEKWSNGVEIMENLQSYFHDNQARMKDIRLCEALGIQFESGYNILCFYKLRDELLASPNDSKYHILDQMKFIVSEEIKRSSRMIELCENDSRLGFHPEAEDYKYSPGKLECRIEQLKKLLDEDFPKAEKYPLIIQKYEGMSTYDCKDGSFVNCKSFKWKASCNKKYLTIDIDCAGKGYPDQIFISVMFKNSSIYKMDIYRSGLTMASPDCSCQITETINGWKSKIKISMNDDVEHAGLSIIRIKGETDISFWGGKPLNYRLGIGMYNPKRMGLLIMSQ